MVNQKKVLEHCINFDEIVNCDFLEEDLLTKKLIDYYRDFILSVNEEDTEQVALIKNLDKAMYRYIADYRFAKSLKETLDVDAVIKNDFPYLEQLIKYIIHFHGKYEEEVADVIVQTRWI